MAKKKVTKKRASKVAKKRGDVGSLSEKYADKMANFGVTEFGNYDPNAAFKKFSLLRNDEFVFISSSTLNGSTGI